ncbi:CocE/NonD family hydrolase [Halovenus halobia]|uniref:CocE/NonD family hydrolase n=1 Tax=Halovenus halobia TaxID=3396622 RepID=UPI003F563F9F
MTEQTSNQSGVSGSEIDRRTVLQSTATAAAVAAGGVGVSGTASASTTTSVSFERMTIESYDGTELGATLYVPAESGPRPSVLMTHGWGAFRQSPITVPKAMEYAKDGYAVLTYDSRGFSSSEGTVGLNGPRETKDAQRLIDFLANETGQYGVDVALDGPDNPRVGMDGISYAGGIQFQVAAADDRLNAMVPRITWNDLEYSLAPNGVVKSGWLTALLGLGEVNTLFDGDAQVTDKLTEWYTDAIADNEVPDDALRAFEQRSVADKSNIDTPTFLMQGWTDSLFNPTEALRTYRQLQDAGTESRLLFYEGGHDLSELTVEFSDRGRMNDHAVRWMDQHVRGQNTEVAQVSNYLDQRDRWREDEQFPPADTSFETYELANGGEGASAEIEQGWAWFTDEAVTYEWSADEDIELIGEPEIELSVDVEGPEARLFFELFHDGDNINGMDQPMLLDGSGRHEVSVTYPAIQEFVNEGDSIGLEVSVTNTWYLDSRTSDGTTIDATNSRLHLPQRPDGNAPEEDEDEEDDDCWWFC